MGIALFHAVAELPARPDIRQSLNAIAMIFAAFFPLHNKSDYGALRSNALIFAEKFFWRTIRIRKICPLIVQRYALIFFRQIVTFSAACRQ